MLEISNVLKRNNLHSSLESFRLKCCLCIGKRKAGTMAIQALTTLIAHKAINLATELSNSEKRVAGAIIDHFNRRTGQCDPSLDGLAELIGMSRRTVIRAAGRLQKLGLIRRIRHGGHFHRNSYEPVWSRFLQVEAEWNARRRAGGSRNARSQMSPCSGQVCHSNSDIAGTQTFQSNLSKETSGSTSVSLAATAKTVSAGRKGLAMQIEQHENSSCRQLLRAPASSDAVRDAAERRWNDELHDRYGDQPVLYGQIVDAIDPRLVVATTDAELRRRGSGLSYLMSELIARDTAIVAPSTCRGGGPRGYQKSRA